MEKVEIGDIVVLKKSNNGANRGIEIDKPYLVNNIAGNGIYITNSNGNKLSYCIYLSGPADEYRKGTREESIQFYKEMQADLENTLNSVGKKLDFYQKYESYEEYTAEKINNILTEFENSKNPAERIKAIAKILEKTENTNFL